MRKVGGVLLAVAMVLPLALIASPGGAAGAGQTCSKLTGTVTFAPPLPKIGSTKKVVTTFSVKGGKLTGCTGPGGASGTVTLTAKTKTPDDQVGQGPGIDADGEARLAEGLDRGQCERQGDCRPVQGHVHDGFSRLHDPVGLVHLEGPVHGDDLPQEGHEVRHQVTAER
jgi:hypothetical protein